MISQAGGNDEQSGISWYIYYKRVDAGGKIIKPPMFGWDGWGLNTVGLFQMKNNAKQKTKTRDRAGGFI